MRAQRLLLGFFLWVATMMAGALPAIAQVTTGAYTAPFLNPGTYEVTIEVQGFQKAIRELPLNEGRFSTFAAR